MPYATRGRIAACTALLAALTGGLSGGLSGTAQAVTYPIVTMVQSVAAMPSASALPGGVKQQGKVDVLVRPALVSPCPFSPDYRLLPLGDTALVAYSAGAAPSSPHFLIYRVATVTYSKPAAVKDAMYLIRGEESACAKPAHVTYDGHRATVTRALLVKAASGGWTGYHAIDHVTYKVGHKTVSDRFSSTILARGNVILAVEADDANVGATLGQSQARLTTVLHVLLNRLSAVH